MEIRHLEYLLGIVAFALLLFLSSKIKKRVGLVYSSVYATKKIGCIWLFINQLPKILYFLTAAAFVIALSAPFSRVTRSEAVIEGKILVPCIDVSGSMDTATSDGKQKLGFIKNELLPQFLDSRKEEDALGLVAFSGGGQGWGAGVIQYPTVDKKLAIAAVKRIVNQMFGSTTAIGEGLFLSIVCLLEDDWDRKLKEESGIPEKEFDVIRLWSAVNALPLSTPQPPPEEPQQDIVDDPFIVSEAARLMPPEKNTNKVVILFSDGDSNTGTDPLKSIWLAQRLGIKIYYVEVLSANAQLDENRKRLIEAIKQSGGEYFGGQNYEDVRRFFNKISELEKNKIYVKSTFDEEESYEFWVRIGCFLIILWVLVEIICPKN